MVKRVHEREHATEFRGAISFRRSVHLTDSNKQILRMYSQKLISIFVPRFATACPSSIIPDTRTLDTGHECKYFMVHEIKILN